MRLRVVAAVLAIAASAHANGRYAGAYQIVAKPNDPDVLLTRTTFGLLLSTDRGANWDWICEGAIGYGADASQEDPTIAMTGGGSIVVGLQAGLAVSTNGGCAWSFVQNVPGPVIDVTIAKSTPSTAVVISSSTADGGWTTVLSRSTDDGKNFSAWGVPIDPTAFPITVDVAPSDAQTVYVSARRGFGNVGLFVSTNGAASWTERPIAVTMTEKDAYIAAVDPVKSDRLWVRTFDNLSGGGRLLQTDNAGQSWQAIFSSAAAPLNGFALSPDGATIWVGDDDDGLVTIVSGKSSTVNTLKPKCLGAFGTRLYACTDVKQEFLSVSENAGTTFTQLLPFCGLRGPLACATSCAVDWPGLKAGLGYPCPDAGTDDAGMISQDASPGSDGGTNPPPPKSGCSCESGPPSGAAALGLVWAFALLRARRRIR
jgi:MYXO-CTERM domain-containing protein